MFGGGNLPLSPGPGGRLVVRGQEGRREENALTGVKECKRQRSSRVKEM